MEKIFTLDGAWELYYHDTTAGCVTDYRTLPHVTAEVPGNVELDLKRAGLLPADEFRGMATCETAKYESYEWWYRRTFDAPAHKANERVVLRFEGVDCIADYFLNGQAIFHTENAFIAHEVDVTDTLRDGENELVVHLDSATADQMNREYDAFLSYTWHIGGGIFLRKPAHCYGWDIFPRVVSAGLWKRVSIAVRDEYQFEDMGYIVRMNDRMEPSLSFYYTVQAPKQDLFDGTLTVRIHGACGDSEFRGEGKMWHTKHNRTACEIRNPKLWWPHKYGDANIYDAVIELCRGDEVVARRTMNVGLRKLELKRTDTLNEPDATFKFVVNGQDIMACGSNWVPLDAYHSRDKQRYAKAMELVSDIGCNILRVWGGGVYEQDEFYDYCDRHGILVWQDFMMACQAVPMDDATMANLEQEFRWVIRTLRHHPSIALWAGDNEIDEAMAFNSVNPEMNDITRKLLPKLVQRLDPDRPYLPSSPYLPGKISGEYVKGHDVFVERHLWGPRDYFKSPFYAQSKACFVSETGYHGCPAIESVREIVDPGYEWPIYNEQWTLHSSDQKGHDHRVHLMDDQIRQLFGRPAESLEEFVLASQISQAEAKKFFIERIRMGRPQKTGVIWWNLLDGWPQMSDAVVDYFYRKKLAYSYIKRSQAPVALMVREMAAWNYTLVAANDTLHPVDGTYRVTDIATGECFGEGVFHVDANTCTDLQKIRMMYSDQRMLLIEWTIDGQKSYNHYLCGFPAFSLETYTEWLHKLQEICGE